MRNPGQQQEDGPTGAQVRGDIQQGLAGDKKPGFDPAAAPMETDAEAGSEPTPPDARAGDRISQFHPNRHDYQGMFATAMRPFLNASQPSWRRNLLIAALFVPALLFCAFLVLGVLAGGA